MISNLKRFLEKFYREEDGVAIALTALLFPVLLAAVGIGVDLSMLHFTRHRLQQEANLAALAGAQVLNPRTGSSTAVATATASVTSNNAFGLLQNRQVTVNLICSTNATNLATISSSVSTCTGSDRANAVRVVIRGTVPLYFGRFLGLPSQDVTATGVAAANVTGIPKLNIMFVLDTTGSMGSTDPNCGMSKINCALTGINTILAALTPGAQQIGISVFPGLSSSGLSYANCSTTSSNTPSPLAYNANPTYTVFTPGATGTTNFRATDPQTGNVVAGLNTSSSVLVKSLSTSVNNCGVTSKGGVGTFFADAITAAQTQLANSKPAGADWQNVMVVLSDGDASASQSNMPTGKYNNQCQQAVTAAQAAKTAGTWVYALAYDANTAGPPSSCSTDTGLSACNTMKQIASDTSKFYSSASSGSSSCLATGGVSMSNIAAAFADIPARLSKPRLIPIE